MRSIGVSNFSIKKLQELFTYARIKPAVNQVCACLSCVFVLCVCVLCACVSCVRVCDRGVHAGSASSPCASMQPEVNQVMAA